MTTEHNNPPAFPMQETDRNPESTGMTLLDHFAGLAMQGLINVSFKEYGAGSPLAHASYEIADAMLKERAKWVK